MVPVTLADRVWLTHSLEVICVKTKFPPRRNVSQNKVAARRVAKVVRIRQPDCNSGPQGGGSSPLLPTECNSIGF